MSDYVIAFIIPLAAVAITFVWVPLLNFVCPPCGHSLQRRSFKTNPLQTLSSLNRFETQRHS